MIVQIYEVTTPEEARALSAMGVDHVGVLVGDGSFPREQTIGTARQIFATIRSGSKASALSLSHDLDLIASLTATLPARHPAPRRRATAPLPSAVAHAQS